jgi:hypothetical protein
MQKNVSEKSDGDLSTASRDIFSEFHFDRATHSQKSCGGNQNLLRGPK